MGAAYGAQVGYASSAAAFLAQIEAQSYNNMLRVARIEHELTNRVYPVKCCYCGSTVGGDHCSSCGAPKSRDKRSR